MFIVDKKYADIFVKIFFTFDKEYDLVKFHRSVQEVAKKRFNWHLNSVIYNKLYRHYESHHCHDIEYHNTTGLPEIETKRSSGKVDIFINGVSVYINHAFGDMSLVYRYLHEVLRMYNEGFLYESNDSMYYRSEKNKNVTISNFIYQCIFGIDRVTSLIVKRVNVSVTAREILKAVYKQCQVKIDFIRQSKNNRNDGAMTPQVTGTLIHFDTLIKHDFDLHNLPESNSVSLDELAQHLSRGRRKTLLLFSDLRKNKCMDRSNELHFVRCSGINYYLRNLVYDIIIINLVQYEKEYVDIIFNYSFKNNSIHNDFKRNIDALKL